MKKWNKQLLAAGAAGLLALACAGAALAQSPVITLGSSQTVEESGGPGAEQEENIMPESVCIWGPVLEVREHAVVIDNQSGASFQGEVVLQISEDRTRVLNAVDGMPADLSDIQVGEVIYANIGMAMTLSLPPQTAAEAVICKIPADFKVPEYIRVKSVQWNEDGSGILTSASGTEYQVPADCPVNPYLTRNIVTLEDITESRKLLIWSDAENVAQNLLLFAD